MVKIRLSLGSAISLGLINGKLKIPFTTLYMMVGDECISNCAFCTQSKEARIREKLSRVTWYEFSTDEILKGLKNKKYSRICFQTLDYPYIIDDLLSILPKFTDFKTPISVSIAPPLNGRIEDLAPYIDTISIALDGANKNVFERIKGKYRGNRFTWEGHWNTLLMAKKYFKNVNTHIIVGLGESDFDLIDTMVKLRNHGITTALFAYTPVFGDFSPPPIERYRKIQISRYLIYEYNVDINVFKFNDLGDLEKIESKYLEQAMNDPRSFMTSGCPGCNRPFYNEEPRNIYNYPYLPDKNELSTIKDLLAKIK